MDCYIRLIICNGNILLLVLHFAGIMITMQFVKPWPLLGLENYYQLSIGYLFLLLFRILPMESFHR